MSKNNKYDISGDYGKSSFINSDKKKKILNASKHLTKTLK